MGGTQAAKYWRKLKLLHWRKRWNRRWRRESFWQNKSQIRRTGFALCCWIVDWCDHRSSRHANLDIYGYRSGEPLSYWEKI
jgi:hypothetical protein